MKTETTKPPGLRKEVVEIERAARQKFEALPKTVKQVFGEYMAADDAGMAGRLLRLQGFSLRESARMIIFVQDLS